MSLMTLATAATQTVSAADTLSRTLGGLVAFGIMVSIIILGCLIRGAVLRGLSPYKAMEKKDKSGF